MPANPSDTAILNNPGGVPPYDPRVLDLGVFGATGLTQFNGYIREEFIPELQGVKGRMILKEMRENDPIIGAFSFAIEMLIRQVGWEAKAADTTSAAAKVAEFFQGALDDMAVSLADTMAEVFSMLTFGWSFFEIVYKHRVGPEAQEAYQQSKFTDGKVGWRKFSIRAQETLLRWQFDTEGGVRGLWQIPPPDYRLRYVPIEKALLFRTTSRKGSPEGRSVLRSSYRPWYFKKHIEQIEGIGIERDLAGLPVMYAPLDIFQAAPGTDQAATLQKLQDLVTRIRRDEQEGVIMPLAFDEDTKQQLYKLELLSTGGTRQFELDKTITRKSAEIAMSVLADFILLGHEQAGSWALSSTKSDLFTMALSTWCDHITETFTVYAFPRLAALNGVPHELVPKLVHGEIKSVDLSALGGFIQVLAQAGMPLFPNEELSNYLLEQAHLPVPIAGASKAVSTIAPSAGLPAPGGAQPVVKSKPHPTENKPKVSPGPKR